MSKKLLIVFLFFAGFFTKAQCPQVFDYLGNLSNNPKWISCTGANNYLLNLSSNSSWGAFTIDWGDGSPNLNSASYSAFSNITHNYTTSGTDTFVVTLMIPSLSCTMTGLVVMEKPVNASIQIPVGGVTQACAPASLQFINSSTDVSATTTFTWDFGDGSPPAVYGYTNAGQTISHTYSVGTVNCQTAVTLMAMNYCSLGNPTSANFNPIQIYDKDVAAITPNKFVQCFPNNVFTFTNTTARNCLAQGNTFQRQEEWHLGDYWGRGYDSIIPWRPWPPTSPITVAYPGIGTYSVVLRDSNLCGVTSTTLNVQIIPPPVAGFNVPPNPLCQGAPVTFTNTSTPGYFYKWDFGVGAGYVNAPYSPQTFTYVTPGTYTVKEVVYFAAGCSDTAKQVITILPRPTANFALTPTVGCNTLSNVTFTDASTSASSWNWNFGNGNTATGSVVAAQNYTNVGTHVVTLTVTAANLCTNTKTANVVVYQSPVAAFLPSSTCMGSTTTFTDISVGAPTNTINSWNWDFGDGSPTSNLQNPQHTYTSTGVYNVTLTVSSSVCTGSVASSLTVNVKPTAAFTVNPTNGCPALTVNFTNTSSNATSFLWDFGTTPTFTSNATNPSFSFTNASATTAFTPTISLIALTGAGCSDTAYQSVTVFPKPVASFSVNTNPGCSPLALTFTNNSTGGTNYNWDFGDGNNSVLVNPIHTYTNATLFAQTFTAQLITSNLNGCSDTITQIVTVNPKPLFTFTMVPSSGCSPLTVSFPVIPGVVTANWDFGDGNTSTSLNPTHTFTNSTLSAKIFTVTLIAQNGFGCLDTAYGMPQVYAKPIADFNPAPTNGCSPLTVNFTDLSQIAVTHNWDFKDGNLSTTTSPVHTFTTSNTSSNTVFNVQLMVVSADGCKDSIQKMVTLAPVPNANFSVDTPACSPKILTFTNLSAGASSYNWDFGNTSTSTATSPTYQYINNTGGNLNYTVTLIATNTVNCKDTVKIPVVIHSQPDYNFTPNPAQGCAPLEVNFPSVPGGITYHWNFGDGNTSGSPNPSHTFVNVTTGDVTYTVQLIASNAYGCADTTSSNVTVYSQPVANFQVTPTTVHIPNDPIHCTNLSTGNAANYWTFGDDMSSTDVNPDHDYTSEGEYQVTLIVTSSKGCKDTFMLPDKIIVTQEANIEVPNAFSPNPLGSPGNTYDPKDLSNDIFHPIVKGIDKARYTFSIYSRWGELLYETRETTEGWDGYYKGKMCTQDVYVWKLNAITLDGKIITKTGDVLLLK